MAVHWQEGIQCHILPFLLVVGTFLFSFISICFILLFGNPFNIVSPGDVPTGTAPNYAWLFTVLKTYNGPVDSDGGLTKYGFHVWGWCEWGNGTAAIRQGAACYGGGAWSIPGSAGLESRVDELDLPSYVPASQCNGAISVEAGNSTDPKGNHQRNVPLRSLSRDQ